MDAEGFRFHLPRFMLFTLKKSDGSAYDVAINKADPRNIRGQYALMTPQQREAIRAFAEFFRDER